MIQFIALLYKNQHAVTLHKLLNLWLESSLSESSEDNESNTSPPDRGTLRPLHLFKIKLKIFLNITMGTKHTSAF